MTLQKGVSKSNEEFFFIHLFIGIILIERKERTHLDNTCQMLGKPSRNLSSSQRFRFYFLSAKRILSTFHRGLIAAAYGAKRRNFNSDVVHAPPRTSHAT